jgi:hypothetical protein
MNDLDIRIRSRGGRLRIPRSRGAITGAVLILLGAWGAAAPFIGPQIDSAFTDAGAGSWTAALGWLQVLPGIATVIGGLLLLGSRNRAVAMLGAWTAVLGGAWLVVGRTVYELLGFGDPAAATGAADGAATWAELALFTGLGALIVFLAAASIGRLSVRSVRDIRTAESPIGFNDSAPSAAPDAGRNGSHRPAAEVAPDDGDHRAQRRGLTNPFHRRPSSSAARRE